MKSNVKMAYKRIVHRREIISKELKSAIQRKEWSKIPQLDSMDIGLLMAEKIIREECPETVHL